MIACNTASALALDTVRQEVEIPVIGVIEPGARAAVRETANGCIGVAGTEATIRSETYTRVIQTAAARTPGSDREGLSRCSFRWWKKALPDIRSPRK